MGYLTVVTSGKGGTGKSTVTVGIASALAKQNKRVLLIDLDEGLRCLDLMLGVSQNVVFDLSDIISYGKSITDVAISVGDNISLIAAPAAADNYDKAKFGDFLYSVAFDYDHIIVDCPAGVDRRLYGFIPKYAEFIVVEPLDMIGCRSAAAIKKALDETEFDKKALVINKFDYYYAKDKALLSLDDIIDACGLPIRGIIPFDSYLPELSANGKLYRKAPSFKAFLRLSKRLEMADIPLPKLKNI